MKVSCDARLMVRLDVVNEVTGDRWTVDTVEVVGVRAARDAMLLLGMWAALRANRLPLLYAYDIPIPWAPR
ncbi:hypothetical protein [Streptomyces scopuliridis]|uniref:Uncharacterized protein n=1 Tax=Streptomyces scopuliridis TaxID=452529 RepID=A0ACD4ZTH9_9ACTN|nr:hypothetical protein [Streptomyces scopuliridis]WSC01269.1 hypothetical protein OG835_32585 [Streptomyces scopuliridis]